MITSTILMAAFLAVAASAKESSSSIDLTQSFGTRSAWRFSTSQGADIADPVGMGDQQAPGTIRLCLSNDGGRTCRPDLAHLLAQAGGNDLFSEPHFMNDARIVQPGPGVKLLLIQVASLHSGDGDQRIATAAFAYDRSQDMFVPVYKKQTGRNNSQEIRYVPDGALRGSIISAEPTNDAPFGFWVTVNRFASGAYKQALRYRSATRYGDGNPLAVIDSEMPNIQRRLGLWRPGAKLPLPHGQCSNPRLIRDELWC